MKRTKKTVAFHSLMNWVFFVFTIVILAWTIRSLFLIITTYAPDFSVYYQAAENIVHGASVYTGHTTYTIFGYPLVSGLIYIPFLLLPYHIAQGVFILLSLLACIGCVGLSLKIVDKRIDLRAFLGILALVLFSFPVKFTFGMGQINFVAYFFLLGSLYLYLVARFHLARLKPLLIAGLFTVAVVLKPILGFVVLFFLLQKQWKILFYSGVILLAVFLLGMVIDMHAFQDYFYYVRYVIPEISRPVGKEIYYNQGFMSFIFRNIPIQQFHLPLSYLGMGIIFSLGLYKIVRCKNNIYQFALLLVMLPLLDTMSWQHHFIVLMFPFIYAVYICKRGKNIRGLVFLAFAYVLVSSNIVHPNVFMHFPKSLFLSNTFYGDILLFVIYFQLPLFSKNLEKSLYVSKSNT